MDTESNFDASSRPYMRLWINDIRGSTADWTCAQLGAHLRLLMAAWERGHVPTDAKLLKRICRDMDWSEMPEVLARWRKVTLDTGEEVYMNNRLERERERMIRDHRAKSDNGRKGGIAKAKQTSSKEGGKEDGKDVANDVANDLALSYSHTPILPDSHNPTDPNSQTQFHSRSSDMRTAQSKPSRRIVDLLSWNPTDGWSGITDQDRADWAVAYPYVNIDQDLAKAHQHLLSNPAKQRKKLWRKFLTSWFNRTQEGGGTRTAGGGTGRRGPPTGHIPPDAHPDEHYKWYMTDGWTPRQIPIYRTADGRERWLNGDYIDEETSQEHADENDQ